MGSVHEEVLSQNKGCHEFEAISLSEVNTIKRLIKNRTEFDKFYETKLYEASHPYVSNGVPMFHEIIDVIYIDLEHLIKVTRLTDKQRILISKLMKGYTEKDISEIMDWDINSVRETFNNACKRLKQRNDFEWQEYIETSGMVKVTGEYKQCSVCGEFLKAIEDNFRAREDSKDGFRKECRNCEASAKKYI